MVSNKFKIEIILHFTLATHWFRRRMHYRIVITKETSINCMKFNFTNKGREIRISMKGLNAHVATCINPSDLIFHDLFLP